MALVEVAVANGVAQLVLNRPDAANAFDLETARQFASAVASAASDVDVRAVLVTGMRPSVHWRRWRSPSWPQCMARSQEQDWP